MDLMELTGYLDFYPMAPFNAIWPFFKSIMANLKLLNLLFPNLSNINLQHLKINYLKTKF